MPARENILNEFLSAIEGLVERPKRTPRVPMRTPSAEAGPDLDIARQAAGLTGPVRASEEGEGAVRAALANPDAPVPESRASMASRASAAGGNAIRQEFDALISQAQRNPEVRFRGELRPDIRPQPPPQAPAPTGLQHAPLPTGRLQGVIQRTGRQVTPEPRISPQESQRNMEELQRLIENRTPARNRPPPPAPEQQIIHRYEPGPQTPGPDFTNIPRQLTPGARLPPPTAALPTQVRNVPELQARPGAATARATRNDPTARAGRQALTPSQAQQPQSTRVTPPPTSPWEQNAVRQFFDMHMRSQLGMNPQQFQRYYFSDYVREPTIVVSGNRMNIVGQLRAPQDMVARNAAGQEVRVAAGTYLGRIERTFKPNDRSVYNAYFALSPNYQGMGVAKQIFRNQIDVYRRMGTIDTVTVNAALDGGGHTWARFGFVPSAEDWRGLRPGLLRDLREIPNLNAQQKALAEIYIGMNDPYAIRALAAMPLVPGGQAGRLGRKLLAGRSWSGTLDLRNPRDMNYFDKYVGPAAPQQ